MAKNLHAVLTLSIIVMAAVEIGISVHKPTPFNIGSAALIVLLAFRAIVMDAARDKRMPE